MVRYSRNSAIPAMRWNDFKESILQGTLFSSFSIYSSSSFPSMSDLTSPAKEALDSKGMSSIIKKGLWTRKIEKKKEAKTKVLTLSWFPLSSYQCRGRDTMNTRGMTQMMKFLSMITMSRPYTLFTSPLSAHRFSLRRRVKRGMRELLRRRKSPPCLIRARRSPPPPSFYFAFFILCFGSHCTGSRVLVAFSRVYFSVFSLCLQISDRVLVDPLDSSEQEEEVFKFEIYL